MFSALGLEISNRVERIVPDPFDIAIGLTLFTAIIALLWGAFGDQLTNMLQPFWALPLLAITGVRARDIVGYTAIIMVAAGIWMGIGLLVFG